MVPDGFLKLGEERNTTQWIVGRRTQEFMPFRRACEWLLHRSGLVDSALVAEY